MKVNCVFMEVTRDQYELPVAVADSARELAALRGVWVSSIYHAIRNAKERGYRTRYVRVELEED